MISLQEVLGIHEILIQRTGGSFGVRDKGLLESALVRPLSTFDQKELYPTIEEKLAVLCRSLISNHCFIDGNKRIGVTILLVLAKANKVKLKYTQDELIELALKVATSDWQEKEILCWIWKHKD